MFWLVLLLGVSPVFELALQAQPTTVPAPGKAKVLPPPLPVLKSPVDLFRELMAMSPAERERELASRPPEIRKRILAKLEEYAAMKTGDRDARLRLTDLRWYFLNLMKVLPGERAAQLAQVPAAERASVGDRLAEWDQLPATEQEVILKYEKTMEQFLDQSLDGHAATSNIMVSVPPPVRPEALQNLDNFLKLPLEQRQQMYASFQRFFELTEAEKQKAVGALPDVQREQMAGLLRSLSKLSKDERDELFQCFGKFSSMNAEERLEFMKNAERWRELSAAERDAWRNVVNRLPPSPPLPPGVAMPPMPPKPHLQANVSVVTNSSP